MQQLSPAVNVHAMQGQQVFGELDSRGDNGPDLPFFVQSMKGLPLNRSARALNERDDRAWQLPYCVAHLVLEPAMPEQLTKHPELTLKVLRSAGARCAEGAPQQILTSCPTERFCKLPGGEICVFGLSDASRMTQITSTEWRALLPSALPESPSTSQPFMGEALLSGGAGLLAGVAIGLAISHLRRRHH